MTHVIVFYRYLPTVPTVVGFEASIYLNNLGFFISNTTDLQLMLTLKRQKSISYTDSNAPHWSSPAVLRRSNARSVSAPRVPEPGLGCNLSFN